MVTSFDDVPTDTKHLAVVRRGSDYPKNVEIIDPTEYMESGTPSTDFHVLKFPALQIPDSTRLPAPELIPESED